MEALRVDNTEKPFTAVEWCAGYAGIHLGLKRVIPNLRVIAFSEIEAFACANLVAKMEAGQLDPAPIWTNLKTFPHEAFAGKVDLLVAGYPCQPFSAAGKRLGTDDERHLWPYIADGIRRMRPNWCFFENVDGHITLGLSTVLSDLVEMGYETTWGVFSASEVGAPHQRKRVFILAKSCGAGSRGVGGDSVYEGGPTSGSGATGIQETTGREDGAAEPNHQPASSNDLAYNQRQRVQELGDGQPSGAQLTAVRNGGSSIWPSLPGEQQHWWEPPRVTCGTARAQGDGNRKTEPTLGRNSDGPADRLDYAELCESSDNRVDELRLLGNGVVPATAARAWEVLSARFETTKPLN